MTGLSATFTRAGKRVLIDGAPIKSLPKLPKENIDVWMMGPRAAWLDERLPPETFLVYVHTSGEARDTFRAEVTAARQSLPLFPRRRMFNGAGSLDVALKMAPKTMVALAEVVASNKPGYKGLIVVNFMVVRPAWRRNGILLRLMQNFLVQWPKRKLKFDEVTRDGAAFARAVRGEGLPIASDQEYVAEQDKRTRTRLLNA